MGFRPALAALLLAGVGLLAASPAAACSVSSSYRVPTALGLAAKADVVVLATVTGERKAAGETFGTVLAMPTLLLKGAVRPSAIALRGSALADDLRVSVTRSDPRELRRPNPDAMRGGCVRYFFRPGMQLLLFLRRDDKGVLTPVRHPFSRDAEDVAGPDALWVKAVREYVAVSRYPRAQWPERLRRRAATLRASGDADRVLLAADMDRERMMTRQPPVVERQAASGH